MNNDTNRTNWSPPAGWRIGGANVVAMGRDGSLCPTRGAVLCTAEDRDHLHTYVSRIIEAPEDDIHAHHDCGDSEADRIVCELDAAIGNLEVLSPSQRTDDLVGEARAAFDRLCAPAKVDSPVARPDHTLCPARAKSSIDAYCELGLPPGDFVRSVLANDLYGAVTRADDVNLPALQHVVAYVVKRVPASLCGSMAAVNKHLELKAYEREKERRHDVREEVQS